MEDEAIRAEIAEIRTELTELTERLDELIALLEDGGGDGNRRKFKVIRGGLGASALPIVARVRRPRHPIGVGIATALIGALAAVIVVPAHTTSGSPGAAKAYTPAPAVRPRPARGATPRGDTTPTGSNTTAPVAPMAPVAAVSALPTASTAVPSLTPSASPSASASPPILMPSTGTPASPPASVTAVPSSSCLIEATVTGVLDVCVL